MVAWDEELLMWDDPNGLIFIGGDLEPDSLLVATGEASSLVNEDDPFLWWSPDPRSIFDFDTIHFSKRLLRTVRQKKFVVTIDLAFPYVMQAASISSARVPGSLITCMKRIVNCIGWDMLIQ